VLNECRSLIGKHKDRGFFEALLQNLLQRSEYSLQKLSCDSTSTCAGLGTSRHETGGAD